MQTSKPVNKVNRVTKAARRTDIHSVEIAQYALQTINISYNRRLLRQKV